MPRSIYLTMCKLVVWSDQFSRALCQTAPSIPTLVSPAANSLTTTYTPLLDWNNSLPTPDHYELQVATDNLFTTSVVIDQNTGTNSNYQLTNPLTPNSTYYWRVSAYNAIGPRHQRATQAVI